MTPEEIKSAQLATCRLTAAQLKEERPEAYQAQLTRNKLAKAKRQAANPQAYLEKKALTRQAYLLKISDPAVKLKIQQDAKAAHIARKAKSDYDPSKRKANTKKYIQEKRINSPEHREKYLTYMRGYNQAAHAALKADPVRWAAAQAKKAAIAKARKARKAETNNA